MTNPTEKALSEIGERIAKIDGQIASSWALHARDEYEKQFKDSCKNEIMQYVTRIIVSALIFLAGVGYFLTESLVRDGYYKENKKIIDDFQNKYELSIKESKQLFGWQRYHNYAKNYIYMAEFYNNSNIESDKKTPEIEKALGRAETYFKHALSEDRKQGSTYWELGEIYYTHSDRFKAKKYFDPEKALLNYQLAIDNYKDKEIADGWRADAYRMSGKILFKQAGLSTNESSRKELLGRAKDFLAKAQTEYNNASIESREYIKDGLEEVQQYLLKIASHNN